MGSRESGKQYWTFGTFREEMKASGGIKKLVRGQPLQQKTPKQQKNSLRQRRGVIRGVRSFRKGMGGSPTKWTVGEARPNYGL